MKAIALIPGTTSVEFIERPEPSVSATDEVKVKVLEVGICGTGREEVAGGRARAPEGRKELIIGHEMLGRVEAVGKAVRRVQPGDYVVLTVRRGCGRCLPCAMNRSDMCRTGEYRERGIWGMDGYQAAYVVDREEYAVRVPPELKSVGVLSEPLSIAEKAIDEAVRLQSARLPDAPASPDWLFGRRCLVAGLGPVGLLASLALRLRGAEVFGLDIVDPGTTRPEWLKGIGGRYIDGKSASNPFAGLEPIDLIFEATGIPSLAFNLLDALAPDGVYVLTGIPGGNRPLQIHGSELVRRLVLDNQVMVGSVNASRDHFQMAVRDLLHGRQQWGDHLSRLITHRYSYTDVKSALERQGSDEIKEVACWESER